MCHDVIMNESLPNTYRFRFKTNPLEKAGAFPLDACPNPVKEFAEALATQYGVEIGPVAVSCLAASGAALGAAVRLNVPDMPQINAGFSVCVLYDDTELTTALCDTILDPLYTAEMRRRAMRRDMGEKDRLCEIADRMELLKRIGATDRNHTGAYFHTGNEIAELLHAGHCGPLVMPLRNVGEMRALAHTSCDSTSLVYGESVLMRLSEYSSADWRDLAHLLGEDPTEPNRHDAVPVVSSLLSHGAAELPVIIKRIRSARCMPPWTYLPIQPSAYSDCHHGDDRFSNASTAWREWIRMHMNRRVIGRTMRYRMTHRGAVVLTGAGSIAWNAVSRYRKTVRRHAELLSARLAMLISATEGDDNVLEYTTIERASEITRWVCTVHSEVLRQGENAARQQVYLPQPEPDSEAVMMAKIARYDSMLSFRDLARLYYRPDYGALKEVCGSLMEQGRIAVVKQGSKKCLALCGSPTI